MGYSACLKSLMKIGHKKAFLLLFLHYFKIHNLPFTLTCITGNYFTKPWPDWGHLGLFMVIWVNLDWFKLIWGQWGSFNLPWLLVSLLKILFHLNIFFYLNCTWMMLTQAMGTLSSISLFFKRKRERGWQGGGGGGGVCLLSAGTKPLQIEKSETTYVPP